MKFIQIKDGIIVNVDHIVAIEQLGKTHSTVHTVKKSYASTLPYNLLANMINQGIEPSSESTEEMARAYLERVGIQVP